MKLQKIAGATSEIWQVFIRDSSSSTGAGLTGLAFGTSGLTAYYHRDTDTTATAVSLVTMTVGTFTSSGFKEIDATNMPGWYQFCPPNAALASGAKSVGFHFKGATNMAPLPIEVQLTAINPDDSVRQGMTALPNAAAGANGGLPLSVDASGRVDVLKVNGTSQTAGDIYSKVSGLTFTVAGQIDANVLDWKSSTAPAMTGDAYARLGAPSGASISADIAAIFARIGAPAGASISADVAAVPAAVWAVSTRLLTAGTNIVLAKGTGVTGFNDLDASSVRAAVGLASANLDTQLSAINTKTTNLPSDPADASDIAAAFSTVNGTLATIAGYIDTEVASILTAALAIKTKTDSLTFTVAGQVNADITYVNSVKVNGDGAGTPWGP